MDGSSKYLEKSWKRRTDESRRKALEAIESLKKKHEPVNFSTVQKRAAFQNTTCMSMMKSEK